LIDGSILKVRDGRYPSINIVIQGDHLAWGDIIEGFGSGFINFAVDTVDVSAAKDGLLDGILDDDTPNNLHCTIFIQLVVPRDFLNSFLPNMGRKALGIASRAE